MLRKSRFKKKSNHFKYRQFYRAAEENPLILQQDTLRLIAKKKRPEPL